MKNIILIVLAIVIPIWLIDELSFNMRIYDTHHFDYYKVKESGLINKNGVCTVCGKKQFQFEWLPKGKTSSYSDCEHRWIWEGPDDFYVIKRCGKYTVIHHSIKHNTLTIQGIDSTWVNVCTFNCQDFIDKNKNFIIKNAAWGREYTWGKSDGVWYVKSY